MRFKAKSWTTGNSLVLTIPSALDVEEGEKFWVTLEEYNEVEEYAEQP